MTLSGDRFKSDAACRILLVEDEQADVEHFLRLCRKHKVSAEIAVARDGGSALDILKNAEEPRSIIVVTDLNLPGMSGHELIDEIRRQQSISNNVIFVFSTSDLPEDIDQAYANHVAGYIVKDVNGAHLEAGVCMLQRYLSAVVLP